MTLTELIALLEYNKILTKEALDNNAPASRLRELMFHRIMVQEDIIKILNEREEFLKRNKTS